jgi:hypothetical protein
LTKSHLDAFESSWVAIRKGQQHVLARDAKSAEAVQDGLVKAANLRKVWINVKWVVVTIEPIQSAQVLAGPFLHCFIWRAPDRDTFT